MFSEHVTLLNDIMVAYPHRNPNCNTLDEFIAKMEGFRVRYQNLLKAIPNEKVAELLALSDRGELQEPEAQDVVSEPGDVPEGAE